MKGMMARLTWSYNKAWMDEELKIYLGEMRSDLQQQMESSENRIVTSMAAEIGSLHSEMQSQIVDLRSEIHGGLARIDERLDRQGFMLAGGTKALGGLLEHLVLSHLSG
jgi:hypothetical protein